MNAVEPSLPVAQPHPGSYQAWLLACRPATLTAAVAPVLVGTAAAGYAGPLRLQYALATLLGASLLQIASNFANDVFDFEKGADTSERLGPTRAVQSGLLSAQEMKRGLIVVLALALLVGSYITFVAGWPIVVIGLSSMVAAVAYTGGPYPLGYHGWGDLFVFLFFGLVAVGGTCFVQAGQVTPLALLSAVPIGALATNILVVNNLRDRHTDLLANKRTLAVRFGRSAIVGQYMLQFTMSYLVPPLIWALGWSRAGVLLPLLSLPLGIPVLRRVLKEEGKALNPVLGATARLVFVFGALFALGLFLGRQS